MNFFTALEKKSVVVHTSIGDVTISRPTFRQHILINQAQVRQDNVVDRAHYVYNVLSILLNKKVDVLSIDDALAIWFAFDDVFYMSTLPWQEPVGKGNRDTLVDDNVDYDGRGIAWIVSLLASTFSWTAEYILDSLSYPEVITYVQEAMLENHHREEFLYNLSEVGFRKSGDDYVKVPYPSLPWVKKKVLSGSADVKTPKEHMPDGIIVDFSKYAETGEVSRYEIPKVGKTEEDPQNGS